MILKEYNSLEKYDLLEKYGLNDKLYCAFQDILLPGCIPARIIAEHKSLYRVISEGGERFAEISGKYRYRLEEKGGYPAVGDWVVLEAAGLEDRGIIHDVLPRSTLFWRKDPWSADGIQVVAANFDTVLICSSLNKNFNLRRMERYLALSWESGATPVIILSKADLCEDVTGKILEVKAIAPGVRIHTVSAVNGTGLDEIAPYVAHGKTAVLLGSSGVGKSTLINVLAGQEILKTSAVREDDDMGRHTTTYRQMVLLPQGGVLLDTPGMREMGLIDAGDGVADAFSDIAEMAASCKFSDCRHGSEPGCAVKTALAEGILDYKRYESYVKLSKESAYAESKENRNLRLAQRKRAKDISKFARNQKVRRG